MASSNANNSRSGTRRLYLCIKSPGMRKSLRAALRNLKGYDVKSFTAPTKLDERMREDQATIVACREILLALKHRSSGSFGTQAKKAAVILALESTQLNMAATFAGTVDSLLFVGLQLARAKDIVRISSNGYFLVPQGIRFDLVPELDLEPTWHLSGDELRVLDEIGRGFSNRLIGEHLGATEAWVKFIVHRLLGKLGARNRTQLAVLIARCRQHRS
jgi:DNA-binding NarL/FixJ family response regulator